MTSRRIDLLGQQFGYWTVVELGYKKPHRPEAYWKCVCVCGKEGNISSSALRSGMSKSCGCQKPDMVSRTKRSQGHGMATRRDGITTEYALYHGAKGRAKRRGIEFNLELDDIQIPSHCPILGIELHVNTGRVEDNSPSIDRVDNNKGYIKGNVAIISKRANTIKNNATPEDLEKLLAWLRAWNLASS